MTFESLPKAVSTLQDTVNELLNEVKALRAKEPINDAPIDGVELRKRLQISRPTEIAMRKKGTLPYLLVNGHYRYNWQDVQNKLSNK